MNGPRLFQHIPISIPVEAVKRRLGYSRKHNVSGIGDLAETERVMKEASEFIQLRGALVRAGFSVTDEEVRLDNGTVFPSRQTAKLLKGCTEALLLGITGGADIIREIERLIENGEMKRAVIFDAAASEIVDEGFVWMIDLLRREILRNGGHILKHRFSAGYGDLDLTNQKYFYDILGMKKLDVELNQNCILIPEKSVTAITGIYYGTTADEEEL